jgi:hypothetical protein
MAASRRSARDWSQRPAFRARARRIMSPTGRCRYSGTSWATNATRSSASRDPAGRPPSTVTRPSVGASRPTAMCISVVLPAPFGPARAATRPAGIASVHSRLPSTATRPGTRCC